ncbi:6-phosphogluconolactonase [Rheinheimera riviphila]|uniref:6-phosphogluconolactonase n=1 Tax=Rheinheimera riviphila TaxID=1834037 RepID=A0A437QRH0_9GAMM|nr:6-phosphogluconolactonase [Rheinheimera riviphila]RVU37092.1 6-phosphogluconolactonase [Rheinheimera riviphila]
MQLHQYADSNELNQDFANRLIAILRDAIAKRGAAYLVVSGGRTPQGLFLKLNQADLDWSKVTITLADDRFLPDSEADSNERLVKASLLQQQAGAATFISLYAPTATAELAVPELLQRVKNLPTFDAVILGMGEDGHTASLFPCSKEISQGLALEAPDLLAVNPTTAPYQRISFSKQRLLNSRALFLHLVGASKLTVLEQAQASQDELAMPIRAFIHHTVPELAVMFAAK